MAVANKKVDLLEDFVCPKCEAATGRVSTWRPPPPKPEYYYPPPGAYDPLPSSRGRACATASSRYSMYGDTRAGLSARGRNYRSNLG